MISNSIGTIAEKAIIEIVFVPQFRYSPPMYYIMAIIYRLLHEKKTNSYHLILIAFFIQENFDMTKVFNNKSKF